MLASNQPPHLPLRFFSSVNLKAGSPRSNERISSRAKFQDFRKRNGVLSGIIYFHISVYIFYMYIIYIIIYIYTLCISIHQRLRCHRKLLIKYFINYGDLLGIRFSVITKQLGEGKQRMKSHLESDSVINNDCFGVPHVWIDPSNLGRLLHGTWG